MKLIAFFTDELHGAARSLRSLTAVLSISGFAWAVQFTDYPKLALTIKAATVLALLYVAAHDGHPATDPPAS